jgi:tRNA (Thr-GGU) A37 N-methylase
VILKVHPEGRPELPEVGVLATRSPRRPTPIAMTAVRLLERRGNVLVVRGLDALDATPVLDIKPYLVRGDSIAEATVPDWLQRLWQLHDAERPGVNPRAKN